MSGDTFGTAAIRARVLDAWAASPARFREDANAEEDLALGGYRDRVVVELAQNAADAADHAGVPGRLRLRLAGGVLVASNVGAALDAAGVESLSTLRASAKRDQRSSTGRFGVGFAAVLAVTDEPRVASTSGAVRWSVDEARAAVVAVLALADELARRGGHVPALRLPLPGDDRPEDGFDTTVRVPLRDATAEALVRTLLADVDDALLIALPALDEIEIEVDGNRRRVADVSRWRVVRREGGLDPALLAERPTEERARPWWSLAWAVPTAGQPVPPTLHAPTATDEPVDLPALLVCSFPLDPTRRHVAPGPLTDFLVLEAARAYGELAAGSDDPLALVPGPVPAGALDGALRAAVVETLAGAPLLTTAGGRVRPRDAVALVGADERLRAVLAPVVGDLVADHPALARLGTRRLALADLVDLLADLRREPAWWRQLYDALADATVGEGRDALGALPVPLADGRTVHGPRGLLLPGEPLPPGLDLLGLRVVHPDAAHPALLRLGAVDATARTVLEDPAVRAAVAGSWDSEDPEALAAAVLGLVRASGVRPGELPWLAELRLLDEEGQPAAAGELVLAGSVLARLADPQVVGTPAVALLDRWGPDVLCAVGVLATFDVIREHDVTLDTDTDHELPDEQDWVDATLDRLPGQDRPALLPELVAVRDLDVVRPAAWAEALALLAREPALRPAVVEPMHAVLADGRRVQAPSYTAWWLGRHALLDGRPPTTCRSPEATELDGLYDVAGTDLDGAFLAAVGVRTSLGALLGEPGGPDELLDRLADPARVVGAAQLARLYTALAAVDPDDVSPPERIRVRPSVVVPTRDVVVVDQPHHLQLPWPVPPLVVPLSAAAALAELLDVARTGERLPADRPEGGSRSEVPEAARRVLGDAVTRWWEHDRLVVADHDVDWWVDPTGEVHACTLDGLARGLAWSAGRWAARLLVAAALTEPDRVGDLLAEADLEG